MTSASTSPARGVAERWRIDCGDGDVATLVVPPDAQRAPGARHGMRVEVDGALEWTRQAPTENPGATDSMDYHFRREVPVGRPLRVVVKTEARQAQRVRLVIEAEER